MPSREIVLVEDDSGLRAALGKVLAAAGFPVAPFSSAEALLEAGGAGAACFVLDIRLPGMTGLELWRVLLGRGVTAPVLFMTAYDDPSVREEAERLGAAFYLLKPFRGVELVEAVTEAIGVGAAS